MLVDPLQSYSCLRTVRPSKYERQTPETFNWWLRLFQLMESEYAVPVFKRKEVIQDIFPNKIFTKILSLLSLIEGGFAKETRASSTGLRSKRSTKELRNELSSISDSEEFHFHTTARHELLSKQTVNVGTEKSSLSEKSLAESVKHGAKPIESRIQATRKPKNAGPNNPYKRFFKRKPERAAIWRDLVPVSLDEMNLTQKAEAITEMIAIDFVNWILRLGGETTLDVPQVVKMFEIGFNTHAATSLVATLQELPAIPKPVAEKRELPKMAIRAKLHEKIEKDIKSFAKTPKKIAFGRTLPMQMRFMPPKENPHEKWLQARAHENLQTMSAVWEGITHLRSTRAFCHWIMDRPQLPHPKYLKDLGMLSPEYYLKPHYSIDSQGLAAQSAVLEEH